MEYIIIGPILALLVSMKFTDYKSKEAEVRLTALEGRIENVSSVLQQSEADAPKKTLMIVAPVAKAVKELQSAIGV
tara:strand:- start:2198 stop:2425 length:228 start_codon:yes stop_codon:yes gene_type:complete